MNTMEWLYHEMKKALAHFDLSFHQMDEVTMQIQDNALIFQHGKRYVAVVLGNRP